MIAVPLAAIILSAFAAAASTAPRGIGFARTVFNEQKLYYISDAESRTENVFYSLDLTVPWPVSAPAWTKLPLNPPVAGRPLWASYMALSGNGSKVYIFDLRMGTLSYDFHTSSWKTLNHKNYQDLLGTFQAAATDTDDDVVYILEEPVKYALDDEVKYAMENGIAPSTDWFPKVDTLLTLDMKTDMWSREQIAGLLENTKGGFVLGWMYSSVRKSLVLLASTESAMTLYEYHIPTKVIQPIIATGDIPPVRHIAPIFSAYSGRKLVLAPGLAQGSKMAGETQYTSDIHVFDLETSAWTRMADPPVEYTKALGAVSGDHLVLYGTVLEQETHAHGKSKPNVVSKGSPLLCIPGNLGPVHVYDAMNGEWRPEMAQEEYIDRPRQYDLTVLDPDNEVV
ncbi:hypothetical protein BGZ59_001653 [Podila verticillata]|nr:hypothetical protein BGZ59_001653 [Podila verticillata]